MRGNRADRYGRESRPDLSYQEGRLDQPHVDPGTLPGTMPHLQRALQDAVSTRSVHYLQYGFTATTTAEQVSPTNPNRAYFLIQNNGANPVYIGFGVEPDAATGILIPANGNYEPYIPPNNAIFVFGPSGDTNGVILEGMKR